MMRSICLTTSVAFEAVKDYFELLFWVSHPGGEGDFLSYFDLEVCIDCSVDGDVILRMKSDDLKGGVGALVMTQKFMVAYLGEVVNNDRSKAWPQDGLVGE